MRRIAVSMLLLAAGSVPWPTAADQPYDPAAEIPESTVPLWSAPMVPQGAMAEEDWRGANDSVGAFTRGHIDILRWEAENPPPSRAQTIPSGEPLSASAAVRIAFANRPDLFATWGMSGLEQARADIAAVTFALDVQRAWIQAVAAEQGLRRTEEAFEAAEIAAELAARMTRIGNWGQDRLLGEQLDHSDAGMLLAQARQHALVAREALVRKLGLWGEDLDFGLPEALPELPVQPISAEGLEERALRAHPSLRLAAIEAERSRRAVASRSLSMWSDAVDHALARVVAPDAEREDPIGIMIQGAPVLERRRLPADDAAGRAAKAQAHAAALAVTIRSHVREAYHQYRTAYDVARRAEQNAQLAEAFQEETLLRYNGMLESTWDLLASARHRVERSGATVQALADFWLAHANLQAVIVGAEYPGADGSDARMADAGGH